MSRRLRDSTPLESIDEDAITPAPPLNTYMPLYRDEPPLGNVDGQAEESIRIASPPASPQQDDTEANNGPAVAQRRREPVRVCGMTGSTILILMGLTAIPTVFLLWLGIQEYIKYTKEQRDGGDDSNNGALYF